MNTYKGIWKVYITINGFKTIIMVEGTEEELGAYIDSEIKHAGYVGATEKDVEAYKALKLPIYCAPTLN